MVPLPALGIAAIHATSAMEWMTLRVTNTMVEATPIVDTQDCLPLFACSLSSS
jgi:hypothetical protein